jgi:hypothetical protein
MPERKVEDIEIGTVLLDEEGNLYEIIGRKEIGRSVIVLWLWPDTHPVPDYYQVFDRGDTINFIKQGPSSAKHISEADTSKIPRVASSASEPQD